MRQDIMPEEGSPGDLGGGAQELRKHGKKQRFQQGKDFLAQKVQASAPEGKHNLHQHPSTVMHFSRLT